MLKQETVKLEDSNLANYGSAAHVDARKAAAATEKEFVGAGQKVGLEEWRVENRRTAADTPDFGVKRWPKTEYGQFFTGDSYLILNTYQMKDENGKLTDKLGWDLHFWLGNESSQDEIGVAAYKAVELDDLLDDGPVQHRETQGNESTLFQSYFKEIQYLEGGTASGFRQVKPEEYVPRLLQCRRSKNTTRATQVPCDIKSMNQGDVFVLDAGLKVYLYVGAHSNAFEKVKGGQVQHNVVSNRLGKAKKAELDDEFWKIVNGEPGDVGPAVEESQHDEPELDKSKCKIFRLSDASGRTTFTKEAEGQLSLSMLDPNDVFIVDALLQIFVWVGKGASKTEKSQAMKHAEEYLRNESGLAASTPITRIYQGQVHQLFSAVFDSKPTPSSASRPAARTGGAAGAGSPKTTEQKSAAPSTWKTTPKAAPAPVNVQSSSPSSEEKTPTNPWGKVALKSSANRLSANLTEEKPKASWAKQ